MALASYDTNSKPQPAKRGKGNKPKAPDEAEDKMPAKRHAAMIWAQRLKRVFNIDVEVCRNCGGADSAPSAIVIAQ